MNAYANSVGYALEQCYASGIQICRDEEYATDAEMLEELKQLVQEYEQACEIVDDISSLKWQHTVRFRLSIKNATKLSDCYK